jgi:ligand-binding sensor domain-containing protein
LIISLFVGYALYAQERVVSLKEEHVLALKEPGAKPTADTGPFSGMTHTEWTRGDGAPGSISSLAQTTDGYLWIGSSLGLYRFDGVHFASYPFTAERVPLPTQDVASLSADPEGGLWVGLRMTSVVHLRADGSALIYGRGSGLGSDTLDRVAVGKDGSVWALAGGKLLVLRHEHWIDFGQDHGLDQGRVFSFFFDRDMTLPPQNVSLSELL